MNVNFAPAREARTTEVVDTAALVLSRGITFRARPEVIAERVACVFAQARRSEGGTVFADYAKAREVVANFAASAPESDKALLRRVWTISNQISLTGGYDG